MVFVDYYENNECTGRYVYGIIVDIFQDIITVEITKSSFYEWKETSQLWFKKKQVWGCQDDLKQLKLFE